MRREKRIEIRRLERELAKHIENRYDIRVYEVPDEKRDLVDKLQNRMERVSQTNEYPATFNVWSQILLSIALPKAIQLFIAAL